MQHSWQTEPFLHSQSCVYPGKHKAIYTLAVLLCQHILCKRTWAEASDCLHRPRNICNGNQKGNSQYDPQKPVVLQWLQHSKHQSDLLGIDSQKRCSACRTLFGDPPRLRYSSRIFFFISCSLIAVRQGADMSSHKDILTLLDAQ